MDINNDPSSGRPFTLTIPSLDNFCLKQDYSSQMTSFYNELKTCDASGQDLVVKMCGNSPPSCNYPLNYEAYLQCKYLYRDCGRELKNFLAFNDVVKCPRIIRGSSLFNYIQSLTEKTFTTPSAPLTTTSKSAILSSHMIYYSLFSIYYILKCIFDFIV